MSENGGWDRSKLLLINLIYLYLLIFGLSLLFLASNLDQAAILQNYGNILKSCDALDYHDLISCSVKLLTDFPEGSYHLYLFNHRMELCKYFFFVKNSCSFSLEVMKECQESWKAIVIDEFQDTSAMQYGLLRILASNKQITIVGDEDQVYLSLPWYLYRTLYYEIL